MMTITHDDHHTHNTISPHHHTTTMGIQCDLCKRSKFKTRRALEQHQAANHGVVDPRERIVCRSAGCGKWTLSHRAMKMHECKEHALLLVGDSYSTAPTNSDFSASDSGPDFWSVDSSFASAFFGDSDSSADESKKDSKAVLDERYSLVTSLHGVSVTAFPCVWCARFGMYSAGARTQHMWDTHGLDIHCYTLL